MERSVNPIDQYKNLRDLAESQKEEKARLRGSLDQIAKTLKDKGFTNLSSAKKHISKLEKSLQEKIIERDSKIAEFGKKYEQYL